MSTTEHDLASGKSDDALDELFDDGDFDEAMNDALDEADVELEISDQSDSDVAVDDLDAGGDESDDAVDDDELVADTAVDVDAELDPGDEAADEVELDESDDADDHDAGSEERVDEAPAAAAADVGDDLAGLDDEAPDDDGTARHGIRPATTDDEAADDDFELPEIVPATPDADDDGDDRDGGPVPVTPAEAREHVPAGDPPEFDDDDLGDLDELDDDAVSEDILEELRRADIDGPVVDLAPQDDTASARRRPRRRVDYDPAPMPIPAQLPRVMGRKPRVRKVTRVVRHVDPWSVFKIALVAFVVLYIIVLTAGVLLWNVAHATGTVDNVERFFESFGWAEFQFNGGEIYHASWIAGLFVVIGLTGLAVLTATLFNLITDLVGGMRFTVLEEEVVETRVSPMRRFVVRRPEPEVPAVLRDESGAMIREAVVDDTGANERPSR